MNINKKLKVFFLEKYQINQLETEELKVLNNINILKSRGFYVNYSRIIKLNGELKKLQSRIDTLNLKIATGSDEPVIREIKMIEDGYRVNYDLWVYRF